MPPSPRAARPWRAWTFLVPLAGPPLLLWAARGWDPGGDRGLANVLGAGLGLLVVALWLGLFALRSRHSLRLRLGLPLGLLLAALLVAGLVRVEGVRGDMVPILRPRWSSPPAADVAQPGSGAARAVALEVVEGRDFPGFLGAARDGRLPGVRLATDWDAHPPRRLWRAPIGPGWSGFAVAGGWAVTLEQTPEGELVSARDLRSGRVAWTRAGGAPFEHVLGGNGPRATPAIAGGRVVVLGARGWLACLDGRDGSVLWQHQLLEAFGIAPETELESLQYGRSSSPLIVGQRVIVPVGSHSQARPAGLVAFDLESGAVLWEGPPRTVSYSSPAHARLGGVEQVLIVNEASVSGHALEDGRLLWEHEWPGNSSGDANVSQAVPIPAPVSGAAPETGAPPRVLVSKGYGGGALLLELLPAGSGPGAFTARERWHNARVLRTKFTNLVRHQGYLYGLDDGVLECVDESDGRRVWKDGRYGHGQLLLLGETLLVTAEDGRVLAVEPTPESSDRVLGQFQGLQGKCWAVPAFSAGVLLLRNDQECAAWELALEAD